MGTIEIREYRDADWGRLCAIHDAARRIELKNAGLEEAFLPLVVAAGREDLFSYSLRVAQLNGVVAGFCAYSQEEIAWLYVAPESMRKGIGRALVQDALERIERAGLVYLEVLGRAMNPRGSYTPPAGSGKRASNRAACPEMRPSLCAFMRWRATFSVFGR